MQLDLKDHTVFLTVAGSRAYGTNTESSDVDVRGVLITPKRYRDGFLLSLDEAKEGMEAFFDTLSPDLKAAATNSKLEGVIYEIRKFCKLSSGSNPNLLDTLFAADEDILVMDPVFKPIRDNRHAFLSKKIVHTFRGYAYQQLQKSQRDTEEGKGVRLKNSMHLVRLLQSCREILETGDYIVKRPNRQELLDVRNGLWSPEKLADYAKEQDELLLTLAEKSSLPHSPDMNFLDGLCCEAVFEWDKRHDPGIKSLVTRANSGYKPPGI